jgi:hypothetical protein
MLPILPPEWTTETPLPIVINLFGGPGIGKTTMAARLFVALKLLGLETANPEEHAKLALWKGRDGILDQQLIILGQSWETLHALVGNVDVVVMDSPLLLCSSYAGSKEKLHFHQTVGDFHKRLPRVNILLTRPSDLTYSQRGRREDETQANTIDEKIKTTLDSFVEPFIEIQSNDQNAADIAHNIKIWLETQ